MWKPIPRVFRPSFPLTHRGLHSWLYAYAWRGMCLAWHVTDLMANVPAHWFNRTDTYRARDRIAQCIYARISCGSLVMRYDVLSSVLRVRSVPPRTLFQHPRFRSVMEGQEMYQAQDSSGDACNVRHADFSKRARQPHDKRVHLRAGCVIIVQEYPASGDVAGPFCRPSTNSKVQIKRSPNAKSLT